MSIVLIEEAPQCGWCNKSLENENPTEHALTCPEQPLSVFQKILIESLKHNFQVPAFIELPDQVKEAIHRARTLTAKYVSNRTWSYEEGKNVEH